MSAENRFREVYARKGWATKGVLSGNGSRVEPCMELIHWLESCAGEGMSSVCDVGCGDLEWLAHVPAIQDGRIRYHGIDVVPEIVGHHRRVFPWFRGEAGDAEGVVDEDKPGRRADILLVKDVLFHLCNGAAGQILLNVARWRGWKRLLVSTHSGADNGRRRGLCRAMARPFDAERGLLAEGGDLGMPAKRFPRPDGGEWIVWERDGWK